MLQAALCNTAKALKRRINTNSMSATASQSVGPIQTSILQKLRETFQPTTLHVQNDSHKHAGHAGNPGGGPDAETHFSVEIVSSAFDGKTLVQRHRQVYGVLQEEIDSGVHALQLKTKTPAEVSD